MISIFIWIFLAAIIFGFAGGIAKLSSPKVAATAFAIAIAIYGSLIFYFAPWDKPIKNCFSALGDAYPHLSFDQGRHRLSESEEAVKGFVVVRRKGTRDYETYLASCEFSGYRVISADCPECP
ncbi:hypothetical protein [Terasakiella pusilla]|uniref:hypothetical protein n=1 Tax=Terasakiella pusilla TaxID=64973 RepID=UPI003AA7C152